MMRYKQFNKVVLMTILLLLLPIISVKASIMEGDGDGDRQYSSRHGSYGRRFSKPQVIASTNGLYWLMLSPNAKLDLQFCGRWAFGISGQYAWTSFHNEHNLFYVKSVSPEIRVYTGLRPDRFVGLYLGAAWDFGQYDMKMVKRYIGRQGEFYGGTFLIGYTKVLNKRFDVSFIMGLGVMHTRIDKYTSEYLPCYQYLGSEMHNYVGITRLGVQFEYHFRYNKKWRVRR